MYSLKKKITRNLTLNLLTVMIGLLIAFYFFTQQLLHDYILTHLQHDAESLASVIYQDETQQWKVDPGRMSTVYKRVRSGYYYYVEIDQHVIISRSLFDAEFPGVDDNHPSGSDYLVDGPGDERWIIWHQSLTRNDQPIRIWIAEDIAPLRNQLLQYSAFIVGIIVVAVVLLFYLQQRTLRQAFGVFDWLGTNLKTIRQKETERSSVSMPLEVAPLVTEIEKLVEHLSHRTVRTRNAIGNLAHELKRPLQLLSIQQESGQGAEMQNTLGEIRNILERELRRARISGSTGAVSAFHAGEETGYMIDVLQKIYPDIDIEIEYESQVETRGLDRDDMLELVGNLLDNACKFARSSVRLTLGTIDGRLRLAFDDDGQGLEPVQLQQLNRRGQRLDERVAGHGLGLGICRDILDYYRGDISFAKSGLGGLCVMVEIPLA
ncbi:MAG: sensor histidine kinase [Gammaproteobacteria bacterium]|nr:sensor histidine kinase [Gammaproteobacteria bacterium]